MQLTIPLHPHRTSARSSAGRVGEGTARAHILSRLLADNHNALHPDAAQIRSHSRAYSCQFLPIHKGPQQEAYGALQLRVRTFQWKHKSEPTSDYSHFLHTARVSHGHRRIRQCKGAQTSSNCKNLPHGLEKWLGYRKTENITHFFSVHMHAVTQCTWEEES